MKKINYCRVFTQKLRENNVLGIFCEKVGDELLSMLYGKKDVWRETFLHTTVRGYITDIALELEKDGSDPHGGIYMAVVTTNTILDTLEKA